MRPSADLITALRLAGITAATPDPPGGRIDRHPDGTPMDAQRTGLSLLAGWEDPHVLVDVGPEANERKAIRLTAKMPDEPHSEAAVTA